MSAVVVHMVRKSPQVEDGHVRIANELYDAILGFGFTGRQMKVLLAIVRKTYGYGKKEDDVSASQLGAMCAIPRAHVSDVLGQLVAINAIRKAPGVYGSVLSVNKDYSAWTLPGDDAEPAPTVRSIKGDKPAALKKHHYVYRITRIDTGECYVGVRSCDCLPTQDRYIGSGSWIATLRRADIKKDILQTFDSRDLAEAAEKEIIRAEVGTGQLRNRVIYASTASVGVTDSVQGEQVSDSSDTESVQVGDTESVHTITNLPKANNNTEPTDVGSCPDQLPLSEPAETPPPVVLLPLQDGSEFPVTKDLAAEWSVAFKQVDVEAQLLRMRVWLIANTRERKTRRGILRFINSWLSRSARDVADGRRPAANPTVSGASRHTNFQERTYVGTDLDSIAWAQ